VKVSDCCAFFFSFWLEHFGVGLEHFKWHWRPHCYNHSSDIRHFPIYTPEQFFVWFAAAKLSNDPQFPTSVSSAGFEALMLDALATHRDNSISRDATPFFASLSKDLVKQEAGKVYEFLDMQLWNELAKKSNLVTSSLLSPEKPIEHSHQLGMHHFASQQTYAITEAGICDDKVDGHQVFPAAVSAKATLPPVAAAPLSHLPFIGLPNIRNTCWLNASLQCLLHTTELSLMFLDPEFDGSLLHESKSIASDNPFPRLFKNIVNSSSNIDLDYDALLVELRQGLSKRDPIFNGDLMGNQFLDSTECLIFLIEFICPSLFKLGWSSVRTCSECAVESISNDPPCFFLLPFYNGPSARVAASLNYCLSRFFEKERLTGGDKPFCVGCGCKVDHTRQLFLHSDLPNLFFFTLKRFTHEGNKATKHITRKFDVPLCYDFGLHCRPARSDSFRLYAVVGYCYSHYVAYCQPQPDGSWMRFDDSVVTEISEEEALQRIQSDGYIFFWCRCTSSVSTKFEDVLNISDDVHYQMTLSPTGSAKNIQQQEVQEKELSSPFTLPRHFSFQFGMLQNLAVDLVQKQNKEFGNSSVLKQHNDRVYDIEHGRLEHIFPEAFVLFDTAHVFSLAPCIASPHKYINDITMKWFFTALTTLFPGVMLLSPGLFTYKCKQNPGQSSSLSDWKAKFYQRRPYAVLHPANLPPNLERPVSSSNSGNHWILLVFALKWRNHDLVSATSFVLDPLNNSSTHSHAQQWSKVIAQVLGFSHLTCSAYDQNFVKLQTGLNNYHCGVFTMALGLNFVTKTLDRLGSHLVINPNDTCFIGIELRKMVAWDCNHEPALLNACLAMSPAFHSSHSTPCTELVQLSLASKWWRVTYTHDLVTALSFQPEFRDGGLFSLYGFSPKHGLKKGFSYDPDQPEKSRKVPTDGPFFFMNDNFFVKVYCIGLIALQDWQDERLSKRAASAFIDSSATSLACQSNDWWCSTFGLICSGLTMPCAFVCVGREKLESFPKEGTHVEVGEIFHSVAAQVSMFHNDGYCSNVVVKLDKKQAVDFERASMFTGPCPPSLFFQYYARSVAMNKTACIQVMMSQIRASGMEITRSYFRTFYQSASFLQTTFDSNAFKSSPATAFRFGGFWHLMELLYDEATDHGDTTPELDILESKFCIVCHIRPRYSPHQVVSCIIFFEHTTDSSIIIRSAKFDHNCGETITYLQGEFEKYHQYYNLSSEQDAYMFFKLALSMDVVYTPADDYSDDDNSSDSDSSPASSRKKRKVEIASVHSQRNTAVQRNESLDKQFHFLRNQVSADVWYNCVSSVQNRFPHYKVPNLSIKESRSSHHPKNALDLSHIGLQVVILSGRDDVLASQCVDFIKSQNVLSIDTETAFPRFPEQDASISLMQIGTHLKVFLIQVAKLSPLFFAALKNALHQKTLVHWGGSDRNHVSRLLGVCDAVWYDLQKQLSPRGNLKGLGTCMSEFLHGIYSLSKEWTLSGWDLDTLCDRQIAYAALDVASCHILYLHHAFGFAMFQYQKLKFHSFFTPKTIDQGSSLIRHGLSFEPNSCCHYEHGELIQGLFIEHSQLGCDCVTPKRFKVSCQTEKSVPDIVPRFVAMLNSQKFCCRSCSDLMWFQEIGFSCPDFKVIGDDCSAFSSLRKNGLPQRVAVEFPHQFSVGLNRQAYFCLSILGVFLKRKLGAIHATHLVNSVLFDCRYGFICSSLSYFQE
jgi:ubiquitin C-terminal hydrolase